jgi:hypothetical protein
VAGTTSPSSWKSSHQPPSSKHDSQALNSFDQLCVLRDHRRDLRAHRVLRRQLFRVHGGQLSERIQTYYPVYVLDKKGRYGGGVHFKAKMVELLKDYDVGKEIPFSPNHLGYASRYPQHRNPCQHKPVPNRPCPTGYRHIPLCMALSRQVDMSAENMSSRRFVELLKDYHNQDIRPEINMTTR